MFKRDNVRDTKPRVKLKLSELVKCESYQRDLFGPDPSGIVIIALLYGDYPAIMSSTNGATLSKFTTPS